ncbi:hypothetical protein [Lichenibacterium dinghuense]|uniref:hypothetical protein n=1 Tax=Lichenibacterium dinghuense TaxID=2895977 RepID=UPI001F34E0A7|nr:hypothetical protein [Lichenibacterium sp. 6Y81]
MTVDLLAATFWPEGALFGARLPHPHETEPAPADPERPEAADAAARAEGFWAAVVRNLRRPPDAPAPP